jgi:hypothetical protein
MRVAPTCSVSAAADFGIVAPSAIYTPTAFAFSYGSADSIRIDVTSSAMTLGPAYLQAGNTNAWMKFNARL